MNRELSAKSQDDLVKVLKALVEEWTADYVKLFLPESWKDSELGSQPLGRVHTEFNTQDEVVIQVEYAVGKVELPDGRIEYPRDQINYRVKLDA